MKILALSGCTRAESLNLRLPDIAVAGTRQAADALAADLFYILKKQSDGFA